MTDEELKEIVIEMDGEAASDPGKFTEWERDFLADIIDQDYDFFTVSQAAMIEKIYSERM